MIHKRATGSLNQQLRAALFRRQPLCEHCLQRTPKRIRAAVIRDHTRALVNGGTESRDNEQALCRECHDNKTRRDLNQKERPRIGLDGWPVEGG